MICSLNHRSHEHSDGNRLEFGDKLSRLHELFLVDQEFNGSPLFVTDYPKAQKAFYMRENEDGDTVAAFDFLVPRVVGVSISFTAISCLIRCRERLPEGASARRDGKNLKRGYEKGSQGRNNENKCRYEDKRRVSHKILP